MKKPSPLLSLALAGAALLPMHFLRAAEATPAESITVLPQFKVERLHSAEKDEGSWISMAVDEKGRLIVSPQDTKQKLLRITLKADGTMDKIERIELPVSGAMGLLYAFDSLYVNGIGAQGFGIYRLRDTNGDDQYDSIEFLKRLEGGGEHGPHALVLGPDNMIYVMDGNHTKVPAGLEPNSPHQNYQEDLVLPRQWDAGGHAVGILAPGGHVSRTDKDGKKWELMLAGFRNAYDMDFNADGELFTFDSDMEWDWGAPWYRATRINHCVTGAEFGWRSGAGKWPAFYADSLPATVDIGIGCPTGVKFGTKSNFPRKYKNALYAMDWSYGRLVAVHLTPKGASYTATFENLLRGKPLNLTDLEFGRNGDMYFITGGRGTQSGLYRVRYVGPADTSVPSADEERLAKAGAEARAIRHKLESYMGKVSPEAVATAWPYLSSKDRFLRYAARVAIESQPFASWRDRALSEENPEAYLSAALAVARRGDKNVQHDLILSLGKLEEANLDERQSLEAIRIMQVCFARMGVPGEEDGAGLAEALQKFYPGKSEWINRELAQVMIYLGAPEVVKKTLALVDAAPTQEEQMHYIYHLRTLKTGWDTESRKRYFSWFNQNRSGLKHQGDIVKWFEAVDLKYSDGHSFKGYLDNIKKEAASNVPEAERGPLLAIMTGQAVPVRSTVQLKFVKEWKMADLEGSLATAGRGRSFKRGKEMFDAAQCSACHLFRGEGGGVGPDLTAISARFTRRDILESILEPSKVVSEQYQNTSIEKKDGEEISGRIVEDTREGVVIIPSPLKPDRVTIARKDIAASRPSKLSPMPEGLVNVLSKDQILDLLAYLESGGNEKATAFAK